MKFGTPRQLLLLGAVLVALAFLVVWQMPAGNVSDPAAAGTTQRGARGEREGNPVGDLKLESLDARGSSPVGHGRNAFLFGGRRVESTAASRPVAPVAPPPPPAPTGPPPPPPIPLRFIGYIDQAESKRVAVLSDGRGNVFNGKEGDIIEGRYRVVRIGTDSADLMYVDGRGRQTIRLSGQ